VKYFAAIDLITNVADQGLTEKDAILNLKKGLEEHYQVLLELALKDESSLFWILRLKHLPKLPAFSAKKVIKALEKLGFRTYRQTGSHIHLWNEERIFRDSTESH